MLDAGCAKCGRPGAVPELPDVDIAAAASGEEDARVDSRRHRVERIESALTERNEPLRDGLRPRLQLVAGERLQTQTSPTPGGRRRVRARSTPQAEGQCRPRTWGWPGSRRRARRRRPRSRPNISNGMIGFRSCRFRFGFRIPDGSRSVKPRACAQTSACRNDRNTLCREPGAHRGACSRGCEVRARSKSESRCALGRTADLSASASCGAQRHLLR